MGVLAENKYVRSMVANIFADIHPFTSDISEIKTCRFSDAAETPDSVFSNVCTAARLADLLSVHDGIPNCIVWSVIVGKSNNKIILILKVI